LRRHYEGHPVPDAPTSPGENARVMPTSMPRVPEEQLLQPHRRQRRLFADEPVAKILSASARRILQLSVLDLANRAEWIELGMGVFIDRPLGYAKAVAEPDQTPLLAHEAFSPPLARRRWQELQQICLGLNLAADEKLIEQHSALGGLPHIMLADCPRPVAALTDLRRVADDFVILRTLARGLDELMRLFAWRTLATHFRLTFLDRHEVRWCVQALDDERRPVLAIFDAAGRRRLDMRIDASQGYASRAGMEFPSAGLEVITVWEDTDDPAALKRQDLASFSVHRILSVCRW
jgi:hypothetical protein